MKTIEVELGASRLLADKTERWLCVRVALEDGDTEEQAVLYLKEVVGQALEAFAEEVKQQEILDSISFEDAIAGSESSDRTPEER